MGQYYKPILSKTLLDPQAPENVIWLDSWEYDNGAKLMEHSYVGNNFVNAVENLLTEPHYFVWCGDYADHIANFDQEYPDNWYTLSRQGEKVRPRVSPDIKLFHKLYPYILNHTKKEYVKRHKWATIHPLPLLTCNSNGRGGGDYRGPGPVGIWAEDLIQVSDKPLNYKEIKPNFYE